jgi:hypothetical protein
MQKQKQQLTWYGFPAFNMLIALPSSLILGSPGWNGSTFPVWACALLKLDASTTATFGNSELLLTMAKTITKRKRGNITVVRNASFDCRSSDDRLYFSGDGNRQQATSIRSTKNNMHWHWERRRRSELPACWPAHILNIYFYVS